MAINDWPEDERPRERLLSFGPQALSDAELLAIFLRTGMRGLSAVDLARGMLGHFGSLARLLSCSLAEFSAQPGMGPAKYAQLMAARELARRALAEEMKTEDVLGSPDAVRQYLRLTIGRRDVEVFLGVFLSARHQVIAVEELFQGTLTEARIYPREIARRCLTHNAAALIVAHNHPAGSVEPSAEDRAMTASLKQALALVDVRLLDHFVVTGSQTASFAERGWL